MTNNNIPYNVDVLEVAIEFLQTATPEQIENFKVWYNDAMMPNYEYVERVDKILRKLENGQ